MSETEKMNLSAKLYGKMDLRMEESKVPTPGKNEVVVQMQACGICATDLHLMKDGCCGPMIITPENPFYLGHESSGVVCAIGEGVRHLSIGDAVALELGISCRTCDLCKSGKYNLCKTFSYGGLQRYHVYAADFCHKLPKDVSMEEGALVEPLAVGVRACRRGGVTLGSNVLVCGMGPIGLSSLLCAKAMGASQVCCVDISPSRLALAKKMGATHTISVSGVSSKDAAKKIQEALGEAPDVTIECSGVESSVQTAVHATKSGGVVVPVAMAPPTVRIPLVEAATREVDIKGVFSYTSTDYKMAIAMVGSLKIDAKPMISHHFNLEQTLEACQLAMNPTPDVFKIMINCAR